VTTGIFSLIASSPFFLDTRCLA